LEFSPSFISVMIRKPPLVFFNTWIGITFFPSCHCKSLKTSFPPFLFPPPPQATSENCSFPTILLGGRRASLLPPTDFKFPFSFFSSRPRRSRFSLFSSSLQENSASPLPSQLIRLVFPFLFLSKCRPLSWAVFPLSRTNVLSVTLLPLLPFLFTGRSRALTPPFFHTARTNMESFPFSPEEVNRVLFSSQ